MEKKFFRTVFSEADGSGSFGRLASGILIFCVIIWDSWAAYVHGLPSGAEFVLQITGALLPYGAAKTASTITEVKTGNPTQTS